MDVKVDKRKANRHACIDVGNDMHGFMELLILVQCTVWSRSASNLAKSNKTELSTSQMMKTNF